MANEIREECHDGLLVACPWLVAKIFRDRIKMLLFSIENSPKKTRLPTSVEKSKIAIYYRKNGLKLRFWSRDSRPVEAGNVTWFISELLALGISLKNPRTVAECVGWR